MFVAGVLWNASLSIKYAGVREIGDRKLSESDALVLARDLYEERLPGDEPEELEVVPWKLDALDQLILREDFSEGRSIAALFLVREWLRTQAA